MANPYRGEVTVSVAGRAYTLRPTFHILCQLEERIGLHIPALLQRVGEKGLLASEILMILAVATRHDGSMHFDSATVMGMPMESVDLHGLMPALAEFLTQGLAASEGGVGYAELLETGFAVLGMKPATFWQLTPPEFRLLLRAVEGRKRDAGYPQQGDVQAMLRRFPDAPMEVHHAR